MNFIDIILILCFIPSLINGLRKGLVAQAVAIFSIVLGVWLSFKFSSAASEWISRWIDAASPAILNTISFILILAAVSFILFAFGKIIEASIKIIMLGWLNRLLGVIFALVKCALFLGLAIIFFNSLNETFHLVKESTLAESVMYTQLKHAANSVFPYLNNLLFR